MLGREGMDGGGGFGKWILGLGGVVVGFEVRNYGVFEERCYGRLCGVLLVFWE